GGTALMEAAKHGDTESAEILLKYRADVNAKDNKGKTALKWAKHNKHNEVAQLLRNHGAKEGLLGRLFG
ncbi:MAG: ankyrin repeat domain-containing protein, partial [Synergistaceae bacterium]|nr:ankyrin repeat domain-containing protein [Synergistaceae bacterium]